MKIVYFLIVTTMFVVGCSSGTTSVERTTPPPIKVSEQTYAPIAISEDTVVAQATAGGLTYSAVPKGKTETRTAALREVGDSITMKYGEAILIVLDSLNPAEVTIESVIDETTKTVTLRVIDKTKDVVVLTHKCQTVDRVGGGATEFPRIILADGLAPEQVVVTPMCDEMNRLAGYSIRYGAEERGCQVQAQASLRSFHRCGEKLQAESKKNNKSKSPKVKNDTWRLLFYGDDRK